MKSTLRALALSFIVCAAASAQNAALLPVPRPQFLDNNGAPLVGGYLYTCTAGTTCLPAFVGDPPVNPLATFTDSTGSVANANPIVLDSAGRAGVWLGSGNYKLVLQDANGVTQWSQDNVSSFALKSVTTSSGAVSNFNVPGTLTAGAVSATTISGSIPYTATGTGAAARTVAAKLGDVVSALDYAGADIGAQINAAIASLPKTENISPGAGNTAPCGTVTIPAGAYQFTTTIVKPRCVLIEGNSAQLYFSPNSSAAVVIADAFSTTNEFQRGGIRNIWLYGHGGTSIGVFYGGDPAGVLSNSSYYGDLQNLTNVRIQNFNVGVEFGNNAFLNEWYSCSISKNSTGVVVAGGNQNSGESLSFFGTDINNNFVAGVQNNTGLQMRFHGGGVDYNPVAFSGACPNIDMYGTHVEQSNAPMISGTSASCLQSISIHGGSFAITGATGADTAFITVGGTNSMVSIVGTVFSTYGPHTVGAYVDWEGVGSVSAITILAVKWLSGSANMPAFITGNGNVPAQREFFVDNQHPSALGLVTGGSYANNNCVQWAATTGTLGCQYYVGADNTFHLRAGPGSLGALEDNSGTLQLQWGFGNIKLPAIKSTTGSRYVCITTDGTLISQAAACSGT